MHGEVFRLPYPGDRSLHEFQSIIDGILFRFEHLFCGTLWINTKTLRTAGAIAFHSNLNQTIVFNSDVFEREIESNWHVVCIVRHLPVNYQIVGHMNGWSVSLSWFMQIFCTIDRTMDRSFCSSSTTSFEYVLDNPHWDHVHKPFNLEILYISNWNIVSHQIAFHASPFDI